MEEAAPKRKSRRAVWIGLAVFLSLSAAVAIIVMAVKLAERDDGDASSTSPRRRGKRPNIIVMQPDDFPFYAEWSPPPANPKSFREGHVLAPNFAERFPKGFSMPNLERLRKRGVRMTQAYAASPACATSRYSTITGRYPTRNGNSRWYNLYEKGVSFVTIPSTLLVDVKGYGNDCTENNVAAVLQKHGYRTGVVGKWHLSPSAFGDASRFTSGRGGGGNEGGRGGGPADYEALTNEIKNCGFDYADGIYRENLQKNALLAQPYSHNHEWVTSKAIEFIKEKRSGDDDDPFFLYFNPTVPHPNGHVETALRHFTCQQTPAGLTDDEPVIPTMTEGRGCYAYRKTIFERVGDEGEDDSAKSNHDLGAVWIDDSVGALMKVLEDAGELDDTLFLFQLDHGVEMKMTHWENGVRIPQFAHWPAGFGTSGKKMTTPVSTIDVAPTLLDVAGVKREDAYNMDGVSWKDRPTVDADADASDEKEDDEDNVRCLLTEWEMDRALVCGRCHKLVYFNPDARGDFGRGRTEVRGRDAGYEVGNGLQYFHLCDENGAYVDYPRPSRETNNVAWEHWDVYRAMEEVLYCLLDKTAPSKPVDYDTDECSFAEALAKFQGETGPPARAPTRSPTAAPTVSDAPTNSPRPTVYGDCKNYQGTWSVTGGRYDGQTMDCDWVELQPGKIPCNMFGETCPLACGLCERERPLIKQQQRPECVDAAEEWTVEEGVGGPYEGLTVDCEWVARRGDGRFGCAMYAEKCPLTCNACPEPVCEDSTSTWVAVGGTFDGSELDCAWVAARQGPVACNKYSDLCPKACGVCA